MYNQTNEPSEAVLAESDQAELLAKPSVTYKYAGFWMRFGAYIIDILIVFSINGFFISPLGFINNGYPIEIGFWTINAMLAGIVYYVYFLVMTKLFGQTLGKMICGIKVIPLQHETLKWSDLFFREVIGRFIYNTFFILKFLYFVVGFTKEKEGIHDMIGNTRVVYVS